MIEVIDQRTIFLTFGNSINFEDKDHIQFVFYGNLSIPRSNLVKVYERVKAGTGQVTLIRLWLRLYQIMNTKVYLLEWVETTGEAEYERVKISSIFQTIYCDSSYDLENHFFSHFTGEKYLLYINSTFKGTGF